VQTAPNQTKTPITLAFETGSHAKVVRQMHKQRHSVSKRLEQGIKQRQYAGEGILLGECRLILSLSQVVTVKLRPNRRQIYDLPTRPSLINT
jgi:hypothetical protein